MIVNEGPNGRPGGGRHRPLARPHRWRPWKGRPRAWHSQEQSPRGQHRSRPIRPRGRYFSLVGFGSSALHGKTTGLAAVVRALWLLLLLRAATARTSTARVVAALRRPTAGTARSAQTSAAYSPQNGSPPSGRFALSQCRAACRISIANRWRKSCLMLESVTSG